MDHRSRPRVPAPGAERARAQAGSAVNGHTSRRRASRPPALSLHYRNGPERGPTRPGYTETPLLLSSRRAISLKRPGLPAGAARHHRRLTLGGARGPQRRPPQVSDARSHPCQPDGRTAASAGRRGSVPVLQKSTAAV